MTTIQDLEREGDDLSKLIHVLAGLFFWEFLFSLDFEWSFIQGRRKFGWSLIPYFLSRYFAVGLMIGIVITADAMTTIDCHSLLLFIYIAGLHMLCFASTNLAIRTYDLHSPNLSVLDLRNIYFRMAIWEMKRCFALNVPTAVISYLEVDPIFFFMFGLPAATLTVIASCRAVRRLSNFSPEGPQVNASSGASMTTFFGEVGGRQGRSRMSSTSAQPRRDGITSISPVIVSDLGNSQDIHAHVCNEKSDLAESEAQRRSHICIDIHG
ncbi:hypothetical protein NLI96_g3608 [Meripilus lineatus]|uniref:Uncharacterized protein n=1 Tax=Meripilus lineatus TaxID=2056292 RepID=A0AAD5V7X6_9APHY|nr:hypothetical protein NLI96_g3608 [Physisporinus lineatus]